MNLSQFAYVAAECRVSLHVRSVPIDSARSHRAEDQE